MQQFLLVTVMIVIAIIALGMLIYFLLPNKRNDELASKQLNEIESNVDALDSLESVTVIDVKFKGYNGRFTYSTLHDNVYKDQYVLVLTQDGIRCAKVITDPKSIKTNQLSFPPFLLQTIICVADEADLEYYN